MGNAGQIERGSDAPTCHDEAKRAPKTSAPGASGVRSSSRRCRRTTGGTQLEAVPGCHHYGRQKSVTRRTSAEGKSLLKSRFRLLPERAMLLHAHSRHRVDSGDLFVCVHLTNYASRQTDPGCDGQTRMSCFCYCECLGPACHGETVLPSM